MGTDLDAVDASGAAERVWINYWRIFAGRLADLRLTAEGELPSPPPEIRPRSVHAGTYLPLLLELDRTWQVRPIGYDWRLDIDRNAEQVADQIESWRRGSLFTSWPTPWADSWRGD